MRSVFRAESTQRGSVTVEFAIMLPAMVLLLALIAAVGAVTLEQVRVVEAARQAARLTALGYSTAEIVERALSGLSGAQLETTETAEGLLTVRVSSGGPLGLPLSAEIHSAPLIGS